MQIKYKSRVSIKSHQTGQRLQTYRNENNKRNQRNF